MSSTFNRTIEELKLESYADGKPMKASFNRTIEELKRGKAGTTKGEGINF